MDKILIHMIDWKMLILGAKEIVLDYMIHVGSEDGLIPMGNLKSMVLVGLIIYFSLLKNPKMQ
jgi:hypothetical protein